MAAFRNTKIKSYLVPGKRVHLVGIGGVSMRPLGLVLQGMGITVTGSDMNASVSTDELIALIDATTDSPSLFYMPEAEGRAKKMLENTDYCSFFAALGDPDFFKAVIFLFSHKNTRFTKGRFITRLGISEERAEEVLGMLQKYNFIVVRELELDESIVMVAVIDLLVVRTRADQHRCQCQQGDHTPLKQFHRISYFIFFLRCCYWATLSSQIRTNLFSPVSASLKIRAPRYPFPFAAFIVTT